MIDLTLTCQDADAYRLTRALGREEGLFCGISSGSALDGAIRTAAEMASGNVVVIFPDRGDKYLSTPVFAESPGA